MLQLSIAPGPGDVAKFQGVVNALPDVWGGRVLDCGARSGNMAAVLRGRVASYTSLDLVPPADVVASLDAPLPIPDRAFDVAVVLDVLEHTNDLHFALGEVCRVAARHVVVSLPNCFDVTSRLRILRGRHISAKYGLPVERRLDRHRWFLSLDDAHAFLRGFAPGAGFRLTEARVMVGPRRARLAPLIRRWPNLFAPTYLALLTRTADATGSGAPSPRAAAG
mgnify:CR=1 FL=1